MKKLISKVLSKINNFLESNIPRTSLLYRLLRWLSYRFIPHTLKRGYNKTYDILDGFSRKRGAIHFVQIGACDGITGDPIHEFILRDGWKGILVEPLLFNFNLLKANYAGVSGISLINKAVAPIADKLRFYRLPKELPGYPSWWRQISSLSEDHFRKGCASSGISIPEDYYEDVNTIGMRDLMTMLKPVDLLHIDAEGIDCSLVKTMLSETEVRPHLILFESHTVKNREVNSDIPYDEGGYNDCCVMLKSLGYELTREGRDTLAIKSVAVS